MIGTIERLLHTLCSELSFQWSEALQPVAFARFSVNKSTGYTPYRIIFGRAASFASNERLSNFNQNNSMSHYAQTLVKSLQILSIIMPEDIFIVTKKLKRSQPSVNLLSSWRVNKVQQLRKNHALALLKSLKFVRIVFTKFVPVFQMLLNHF